MTLHRKDEVESFTLSPHRQDSTAGLKRIVAGDKFVRLGIVGSDTPATHDGFMPALSLPNGKAANCNDDELRGATVLDIGANKGIYCFWLARAVRISGRVIAFTLKSVWLAAFAVNSRL